MHVISCEHVSGELVNTYACLCMHNMYERIREKKREGELRQRAGKCHVRGEYVCVRGHLIMSGCEATSLL